MALSLDASDFELFGLPERFELDTDALDQQWKTLLRLTHPDRHAADSAAAQRTAMQWSVRINEAYQRLKSPLRRAQYLCERRGAPIRAETNTAMPAAFLMQQMAWREALDDARTLPPDQAEQALDDLLDDARRQRKLLLGTIRAALDDPPAEGNATAGPAATAASPAELAAQAVRSLMFIERFEADVTQRLDQLQDSPQD